MKEQTNVVSKIEQPIQIGLGNLTGALKFAAIIYVAHAWVLALVWCTIILSFIAGLIYG